MPKERRFDIFSGKVDHKPVWLETVEGLECARDRMARRAVEKPGFYFIYDSSTQTVLAEVSPTASRADQS
jgi:hypothetical protein